MHRSAGLAVVALVLPTLACGMLSGEPAGTVLARDAVTGHALWSRDMTASPDRLVADGGAVAVVTFDLDDFYECQFRHGEVVVRDGAAGEKRLSASLGVTAERTASMLMTRSAPEDPSRSRMGPPSSCPAGRHTPTTEQRVPSDGRHP